MKPDWAGLIKDHTRPTRDKAAGGNALTLKKGIVGVSIAAGSARRARIPFLFLSRDKHMGDVEDQSRFTLDVSHDDFLLIRKTQEHATGDRSRRFTVKHYVPWDKIVEIVFVEGSED